MTTIAGEGGRRVGTAAAVRSRWSLGWFAPAVVLVSIALVVLVPASAGSSWHSVATQLRRVDPPWFLALVAVWWAGLCSHSLVLTASLPGLTPRRAIGLNLAGSSVANTVPLGGAISVALTAAMASSWGFETRAFATFLTVSTVANLAVRLLAGALGTIWLLAVWHGTTVADSVGSLAAVVALVLAALAACLLSDRTSARLGAAWAAVRLRSLRSTAATSARAQAALGAVRVRHQVLHVGLRSWRRLSLGMVTYVALLGLLLDLVLRALGTPLPWGLVLATAAVERLVTAVPVTPGGVGVAELALAGCLSLGGVPAADAAAAALLYRVFTHVVEIPGGLLVTGTWSLGHRRRTRQHSELVLMQP